MGGGGLERRLRAGRVRRHGTAASRQRRLHRNLERRRDGVCALPASDRGRRPRPPGARIARTARHLSRSHDRGQMDRDHEPDRASGGVRSQRREDPGGARRGRILSPVRPEDLHHLWRARHGREHRPSRSCPPARRAGRNARPVAVSGAEIPRQRRWLARGAQRPALRQHRAQARHSRLSDLRHGLWRRARRAGLAHRRGEPGPRRHVRDDERGAARRRDAGRGDRRSRLSAGALLRARAPPGPVGEGRRHEPDHRARRCAAHADDDEGERPRRARDLPSDGRRARPCRATRRRKPNERRPPIARRS